MRKKEVDNEQHRHKAENFKQQGKLLLQLQEGGYTVNDSTVSNVLVKGSRCATTKKRCY